MTHKFIVGQNVGLTPSVLRASAAGNYEIIRLMPPTDGDPENPCYRIKHIEEKHERAVRESEITRTDEPESISVFL